MFNVGPMEMIVLAAIALMLFGPDKLPQLTKDAARMLRTLRDLAQGARTQLNNELGPEFSNLDLNSLNPRNAIRNALLGDEDPSALNPKEILSRAFRGEDEPEAPGQIPHPAESESSSHQSPAQQSAHSGRPAPLDTEAT